MDNNSLWKQVALVASGSLIAQGMNFLTALAMTRIYSSSDVGLFGTFSSLVSLVAVASGLRYELALPIPKRDGSAINLFILASSCVFVFATVILLIVTFLGITGLLVNLELENYYLYILPFGIAAAGLYQVSTYWAIRQSDFRGISISRIVQSFYCMIAQFSFSWIVGGPMGLIVGSILSHLAGTVLLIARDWTGKRDAWQQIRWSRMRFLAGRFNHFPKFSVIEGLAASAGTQLPILVFAANFSVTLVGQFVLAVQVAHVPLRLVGSAMGQVLLSRITLARHSGNLGELMTSSFQVLARLGIAPLLMASAISPELFSLTFGEKWHVAGMYTSFLIPILILEFLFIPLSVVSAASEQQFAALSTRLLLVGIPITVMYVVAMVNGDPLVVISSYSAIGCIAYFFYGTWIMNVSGVLARTWIRLLFLEFLLALIPFIFLIVLKLMIGAAQLNGLMVGIGLTGICSWLYISARKM